MPKSQNERKRASRARKKQAGIITVEVYVRAQDAAKVRKFAQRLTEQAASR